MEGEGLMDVLQKAASIRSEQDAKLRRKFDAWPHVLRNTLTDSKGALDARARMLEDRVAASEELRGQANACFAEGQNDQALRMYVRAAGLLRWVTSSSPDIRKGGIKDSELRLRSSVPVLESAPPVPESREEAERVARSLFPDAEAALGEGGPAGSAAVEMEDALPDAEGAADGPLSARARKALADAYNNASSALLRMGMHDQAMAAGQEARRVDPCSAKGLLRVALARQSRPGAGVADLRLAVKELRAAMMLEPSKAVQRTLRAAEAELARVGQAERSAFAGAFERGRVVLDEELEREQSRRVEAEAKQAAAAKDLAASATKDLAAAKAAGVGTGESSDEDEGEEGEAGAGASRRGGSARGLGSKRGLADGPETSEARRALSRLSKAEEGAMQQLIVSLEAMRARGMHEEADALMEEAAKLLAQAQPETDAELPPIDWRHPTPEQIADAKTYGIDLTDPDVVEELEEMERDRFASSAAGKTAAAAAKRAAASAAADKADISRGAKGAGEPEEEGEGDEKGSSEAEMLATVRSMPASELRAFLVEHAGMDKAAADAAPLRELRAKGEAFVAKIVESSKNPTKPPVPRWVSVLTAVLITLFVFYRLWSSGLAQWVGHYLGIADRPGEGGLGRAAEAAAAAATGATGGAQYPGQRPLDDAEWDDAAFAHAQVHADGIVGHP
ncbi:hypothetical protein FNF27_00201 [Cafeteria roenbergensis]|uniref:Uncharacterized protein n=1 Tax=Cafeteria roenbergensis TaxID=33653 RepID=A0A5A8ERE8_CAFRO|nr:hypothetical protein FNF27_00201 [Cafeteria roenbergensis]